MELIRSYPPNFDEISAAFKVKGKPVLFAWGDKIYAPTGVSKVSPHLLAHEGVHAARQAEYPSPAGWWRRYILDNVFRLEEERLAHIAEYSSMMEASSNRHERRRALSVVAERFASPLYGYAITKDDAERMLRDGYAAG